MLVAGWEGIDTQRVAKVLFKETPTINGASVLLNIATLTVTIVA